MLSCIDYVALMAPAPVAGGTLFVNFIFPGLGRWLKRSLPLSAVLVLDPMK